MATIFTQIINGAIPCHRIYEDEKYLAFLDIRPVKKGHALVIPKTEIDYVFDLDDAALSELMCVAKKVARKIKAVIPCRKVGVMVAGLEVPHAHIHLIPIDDVHDLNFAHAHEVDQEELAALAQTIREKM